MTPIFKDGNKGRSKTENYRPLSLTSITCKILEDIIHRNIISHLDQQGMLTDVQHGFRKSQSYETQLIKLTTVQNLLMKVNKLIVSCWILVKPLMLSATESFC